MKTFILAVFIAFLLGFSMPATSQVIDQSQLIYNAGTSALTYPGYSIFQSFTAGMTGTMVEIDMGVFNFIDGAGTLKIYAGPDTTGALLQSTPVSVICPSGNCFTDFSTSVPVTTGNVYTFRFIPGAGIPNPYGVQMEVPGTYAGGQFGLIDPSGISYPGFDQVFITYVEGEHVGIGIVTTAYPEISVYPNPVSGSTSIRFNNKMDHAVISLYNSFGQIVKSWKDVSADQLVIDRNELSGGIYLLVVAVENKALISKKLVFTD